MIRRKSDLPFASQFSPTQTPLPDLLKLVKAHEGNKEAFLNALLRTMFKTAAKGDPDQAREVVKNVPLALNAYGLVDKGTFTFTETGKALLKLADQPNKFYSIFSKHILLKLKGIDLIETIRDLEKLGPVKMVPLIRAMQAKGIYVPEGGTHVSAMRQWLEKAGIFVEGFRINASRLDKILGITEPELEALKDLDTNQRAFLKALARLPISGWTIWPEVVTAAEALYGVRYDRKSVPKDILSPLELTGYISTRKTTKGRGAKWHEIMPTETFRSKVIAPIIDAIAQTAETRKVLKLLHKPFDDVVKELSAKDKHVKGVALEALALQLTKMIDLRFGPHSWRKRAREAGYVEVDVLVEGERLIYSRWQIQCKNAPQVDVEAIAKEVGLREITLANVIMIVTTGKIGPKARQYVRAILKKTNLHIILLDGRDLSTICKRPGHLFDALRREALNALDVKDISSIV